MLSRNLSPLLSFLILVSQTNVNKMAKAHSLGPVSKGMERIMLTLLCFLPLKGNHSALKYQLETFSYHAQALLQRVSVDMSQNYARECTNKSTVGVVVCQCVLELRH